eukprot:scaffold14552_cov146-Isochrysis_galbana.AAC.2
MLQAAYGHIKVSERPVTSDGSAAQCRARGRAHRRNARALSLQLLPFAEASQSQSHRVSAGWVC